MKVLLLGPYPPPQGGVQTHLIGIRQFLLKRQVPCAVINITRHRQAQADEVYYPKSAVELVRLLLRLQYDIIHLHFGGNLTLRLLVLSFVCSLMPRTKTVLTFHSGGYPGSEAGKTARRWTLRGFALRRLDRIIGVNAALVGMFQRFGVAPGRTHLIPPHDLSAPAFRSAMSPEATDTWPESLRTFFATHSPVLVTVGGLETEYGLPLQIDMLSSLREVLPNAGLVIIGSGSLEREIRDCIEARSYGAHILLCGDVPHATTLQAISKSELLLRTTLYDGDSIAVREALQLGTPVLATDNGMRPEGVRLIADIGITPQALARTVTECLLAPPAGRPVVGADFDERHLQSVFEVYRELLEPELRRDLSSSTTVED